MAIFIFVVVLSILMSAICSLTEAALYSVPLPHVRHIADSGLRRGKILLNLKEEIGRPIAALLMLNTISNSGGAAYGGATAGLLWGEVGVLIFSCVFTVIILVFSEILPKKIGVAYSKSIILNLTYPLLVIVKVLSPFIKVFEKLSQWVTGKNDAPLISQEEVVSMAALGTEEGVLHQLEGDIIKNVIGLDKKIVREILTPRVVVFRLDEETLLENLRAEIEKWNFSRIPIFPHGAPDNVTKYVTQRDIVRNLVHGQTTLKLKDLARPLIAVPETMGIDQLLLDMLSQGNHLYAVVDEHGGFEGVISLEDVMETILGKEIVDEYDHVSDMRYYAQVMHARKDKENKFRKS